MSYSKLAASSAMLGQKTTVIVEAGTEPLQVQRG